MVALLIRPQDWFEPVLGLPTGLIITGAMYLVGAVGWLKDRESYRVPHNWLVPTYLLFILGATSISNDLSWGLDQFQIFAKRALVFFPLVWLINNRSRVQWVLGCYLAIALFLAYQAILMAQTGQAWGGATLMPGYEEIRVRWHGDWDGPNVFAILFLMGLAIAIELIFGPYGMLVRLLAVGVAVASVVAIYFTNSRGAMLALMAFTAFYFKDRFSKPVAISLVATALAAMMALGPSRMSEVNTKEESARERSWLWEQGLTMLRNNPAFGIGRGQFHRKADLGLLAHNNYVQNFAETGLPGYFLFVSMLWFCWKAGYRLARIRDPERPWFASWGRMILGLVIGYAVVTFFVVMELELLYFMMGLSMALYTVARREGPELALPVLVMGRRDVMAVLTIMGTIIVAIWLIAVKGVV
jgi:O-antigen ligase